MHRLSNPVLLCLSIMLLPIASGCLIPSHAYSPPALVAPVTGVAPVESGRAEVGGTIYSRDETFDASGSGVNLSGRLGLTESAETNLTLRLGSLGPESRVSPQTLQWATRVGSRLSALGLTRSLSADLGLGVGGHHGGLFVSPDLGLTVGYDNPYVVPFARIDGWLSVPLASSEQDVIIDDTADGEPIWGTQSPPDHPGVYAPVWCSRPPLARGPPPDDSFPGLRDGLG